MAYMLRQKLGLPDEDETVLRPSSAPASVNMAGPSAQAKFSAGTAPGLDSAGTGGSGWVNLQRYLGVNHQQGQQMAGGLAAGVEKQGAPLDATAGQMKLGTVQATGDQLGQAAKVSQDAKQLVDFSGRRDLLAQQNQQEGGAGYSAGMGRWDSFLSGAAGGQTLQNTADRFGGLSDRLGQASSMAGENFREAEAFRLDAEERERQRLAGIAALRSDPPPAAHGTGATTRKIRKQVL